MGYQIAIDGPAGAGKSTIAKLIAKQKGFIYVDTGAMYRAMAYFLLQSGVKADDIEKVAEVCVRADITIRYENGEQIVFLNGENVNAFLRTEEVGFMASTSSANAKVRAHLLGLQVKLAEENDVVMDGRDIGTCVLPNAEVKIFLTASSRVRANRRYLELTEKGVDCDLDEIEQDIIKRDHQDMTREHAPLKQADDAVLVDSSEMSIEEVVAEIIRICEMKSKEEVEDEEIEVEVEVEEEIEIEVEDEDNDEDEIDIDIDIDEDEVDIDEEASKNYLAEGISLGTCFGLIFGILYDNLAIGLSLGLALGVALGSCFKKKKK